jgi:hypothetical protein
MEWIEAGQCMMSKEDNASQKVLDVLRTKRKLRLKQVRAYIFNIHMR